MSLTVQQIVSDAKKLATKLKEHDSTADSLISQTQSVYKQIDTMRQYAEEVGELNETARQRPHSVLVAGIQQENRHLRELQQENKELRAALEEHQNALELIMSKYRQQVTQLIHASKVDLPKLYNQHYTTEGMGRRSARLNDVIQNQALKISEMAAVMRAAAEADEENLVRSERKINKLTNENQGLRELLSISSQYGTLEKEETKQ